jgi:hypothetical protein
LVLVIGLLVPAPVAAQTFSHRGSAEVLGFVYPQRAVNDPTRLLADSLFRWEPAVRRGAWHFDAGVDARMDTDGMTERTGDVSYWDRTIQRPAIAISRLSVSWAHGPLTFEVGKQYVRWGKTDILVPTDRFAPRDYVNVVDTYLLGVTAARMTLRRGSHSLDFVVSPRLTPSRAPLLDQRWVVAPAEVGTIPLADSGAEYPVGTQSGIRWNYVGRLEYSLSLYRGFNHLPWFEGTLVASPLHVDVRRRYSQLTGVGGDVAVPVMGFVIKAEAEWFHSETPGAGEYLLYVVQAERQSGEWLLIAGYAGEYERTETTLVRFAPDRGLARAFLGRASLTIDTTRALVFEGVVRQNAEGFYGRAEYSHGFGDHWRMFVNASVFGGSDEDFLGRYRRNSSARFTLRYSF